MHSTGSDTLSPMQSPPDSGQVSPCKYTTSNHSPGCSLHPVASGCLPHGVTAALCSESDGKVKLQPNLPQPSAAMVLEGHHEGEQSSCDTGTVSDTSCSPSSAQLLHVPPSSRASTSCACANYNSDGIPPPAPAYSLPSDARSCSSFDYGSCGSHVQPFTPPDLPGVGALSSSDKPPPYSDDPVETLFYDVLSSSSCLLFGVEISEEVLGRGSYGVVHAATYAHLRVAAKSCHAILQPSQHIMERFADECDMLSRVRHPSIVEFLGVHMDPDTHEPYIVMELMEGGTLYQLVDSLPSPQPLFLDKKLEIVTDVALALVYLHEVHNIVHRDLSSSNVLLTKDQKAKISDFGVARPFHQDMHNEPSTVAPGCQQYMPPEALELLDGTFTQKSDVFSFGVLMVEVIAECHPRPSIHHRRVDGDIFQRVHEVERRKHDLQLCEEKLRDAQSQLAHDVIDLVYQCLEDSPDDRPYTTNVVSRLTGLQKECSFEPPNTDVQHSHLTHSRTKAPLPRKLCKQTPSPGRACHSIPASNQPNSPAVVVHGGIIQTSFSFNEASEVETVESEDSIQATNDDPSNHSTNELLVPTTESQDQSDGKSELVTSYSSTHSHSSDDLREHGNTSSPTITKAASTTPVLTEEGESVHNTTDHVSSYKAAGVQENTVNDISESETTNENLCTGRDSLFAYSRVPLCADSYSTGDSHHMADVKHPCSDTKSPSFHKDLQLCTTLQEREVSSEALTKKRRIIRLHISLPSGISLDISIFTTQAYLAIGVKAVHGSVSSAVFAIIPSQINQEMYTYYTTCLLLILCLEYAYSPSSFSSPPCNGSILKQRNIHVFSYAPRDFSHVPEMFLFAKKATYLLLSDSEPFSLIKVSTFLIQPVQKALTLMKQTLVENRNILEVSLALLPTPLALEISRDPLCANSHSSGADHHMAEVKDPSSDTNSFSFHEDLQVCATAQEKEVSSGTFLPKNGRVVYLWISFASGVSQIVVIATTETYSVIWVQVVHGSSSITVLVITSCPQSNQEIFMCWAMCLLLLILCLKYMRSHLSSCSSLPTPRCNGSIVRNKTFSSFGLVDSSYFDESLVLSGKASYLLFSNFEVLSFMVSTFPIPSLRKGFTYEQSISPEQYHHMTLIGNKSNMKVSFTLSPTPLALSYRQTDDSDPLPLQQTTPITFCRDDSVPQPEHSQYKTAMTRTLSFSLATFPCIHSVQGNVVPQESSTTPPSLALDSARSIVLCTPTNHKLKPKISVLFPSLIAHAVFQSLHFVITRLLLHTQPLQVEVAEKYLSPSIWDESQDKIDSRYPTCTYKAVVSDWRYVPVVYYKRKRDGSIASPTIFTLKQQLSLFNPCNETQLNPPAKFALFADSTKTSPNQRMLPSALSPSNSLGKSLCLQLKSIPSELYSFPTNKILSFFLLYSRLHEHVFVRGAIVAFCNSITTQSSVVQLCFVHTICCSAFSPKYGSGTVMKNSFHTSNTLLIILLPTSFLPKSLPSVSPLIQQMLPMCANVHPQAASLPMALVPARNIMHENTTHTQVSIQAVQSISKILHSVPLFIQQTLSMCSSGHPETASTLLALVPVENTMHESKTLTLVLQVSSQAVQCIQISSPAATTTSHVGDIHIICTYNPHSFMANLFCATRKVAQTPVLTQLLQSLHYAGPVEAVGLFLQCIESPAHYQGVIWSLSNSLNTLKLAKSPTSQGMVVHATPSPNQSKSPACPVRLDEQSQLIFPRAKSYSLHETIFHLPVSKPGLLASHENIHTTPRPSIIITALGEGEVCQSPIQPVTTRLHTTSTALGEGEVCQSPIQPVVTRLHTTSTALEKEGGYPPSIKPVFLGMKYETRTHMKTVTSTSIANPLYYYHPLHSSHVLPRKPPEPRNQLSIKRHSCVFYKQEKPSNSGMLIPCSTKMHPQSGFSIPMKHMNAMLAVMFNVATVFRWQLVVKYLPELFLIEVLPPHGSEPPTLGYGLVNKNPTPAKEQYIYSIDSLHCLWIVLPFTNSICGEFWCSIELLKCLWDALHTNNNVCVRSTPVTRMMQHANRNYCHMNSQKLKWLISFSLHTPPHSTFNHSSWKISIGKSCNTHTFVCLIAPQISMGDKLTVSDAILPHNPNLLIARVVSAHPVSEQFSCHRATLLPQKHKRN